MGIVVTVMIVSALWIVLGAVLHGGPDLPRDLGREAWWWESSERSTHLASSHSLPPSHPLVAWRQGPGGPGGQA